MAALPASAAFRAMESGLIPRLEPVHLDQGEAPFRTLGEQLQCVAQAGANPWREPDPRLLQVRAQAAGGSEKVPSDGGFLVDPQFSRQIVERMYQVGEIYRRCLEIPITTNGLKFPQFAETSRVNGSRLGGVQCFTEDEAVALVATKPSFELSELVPKKITGLLYVTDELSMDSEALATWATYAFSLELMFTLENLIINGTGAGQVLGVMNAPALKSVAIQTGQATGGVVNQNIIDMLSSLWAPSRKTAIWLYNKGLLDSLLKLSTIVGAAGSQSNLWQFQLDDAGSDRLGGIPIFPCEYCQAPGTSGDVLLADFSRYLIAMREKLRGEVSIHVLFTSDQSVFKFVMRCNGQPIDLAPVTPLHGSVQTSPFVSLASR